MVHHLTDIRWRWQSERYVAVKVSAWNHPGTPKEVTNAEPLALRRISAAGERHPGSDHVRKLLDSFEIVAPAGNHVCMVFEPLRESFLKFGTHFKGDMIPVDVLPLLVIPTLQGLDFLHRECKLVHTGEPTSTRPWF